MAVHHLHCLKRPGYCAARCYSLPRSPACIAASVRIPETKALREQARGWPITNPSASQVPVSPLILQERASAGWQQPSTSLVHSTASNGATP